MILGRVTEHVKAQNWFAVGLDFLIVVFGVFIGLQVSNWNDARAFAQEEQEYLVQSRAEIDANNMLTQFRIDFTNSVIDAGERVIAFFDAGKPCETDCERLLVDFFYTSQVWAGAVSASVFEDMQRLGLPRSAELRAEMINYYQYANGVETSFDSTQAHRQAIRKLIPFEDIHLLWQNCYIVKDVVLEILVPDCASGVAESDARRIVEALRQADGLYGEVNYWIGYNNFWLPLFADQINTGEAVIIAIEEKMERRE
jgi:hypothetical protein